MKLDLFLFPELPSGQGRVLRFRGFLRELGLSYTESNTIVLGLLVTAIRIIYCCPIWTTLLTVSQQNRQSVYFKSECLSVVSGLHVL